MKEYKIVPDKALFYKKCWRYYYIILKILQIFRNVLKYINIIIISGLLKIDDS